MFLTVQRQFSTQKKNVVFCFYRVTKTKMEDEERESDHCVDSDRFDLKKPSRLHAFVSMKHRNKYGPPSRLSSLHQNKSRLTSRHILQSATKVDYAVAQNRLADFEVDFAKDSGD